jgi:hypothetical protein
MDCATTSLRGLRLFCRGFSGPFQLAATNRQVTPPVEIIAMQAAVAPLQRCFVRV